MTNGALFFLGRGRLKYPMRVLTVGVLCGCLFLSGCTRQQMNEVSVIEYEAGDDAALMALKTAGNFVPWIGEFVVILIAAAPELALRALEAYVNSR